MLNEELKIDFKNNTTQETFSNQSKANCLNIIML